nr:hypothetical protein [Pseudomonas sp. Marseille-Q3773]
MKLGSARLAWHDAFYTPWDSVMHHGLQGAQLGKRGYVANETRPERWENTGKCAHMAMAGKVQHAIASLHPRYQVFGHHLYAPVISTEVSNNWEESAVELLASHVHLAPERAGREAHVPPVQPRVLGCPWRAGPLSAHGSGWHGRQS